MHIKILKINHNLEIQENRLPEKSQVHQSWPLIMNLSMSGLIGLGQY